MTPDNLSIMEELYEDRGYFKKIPSLNMPGLILLAARPGMGKTFFALNMARIVAEKKTVAVFSLEMSREQVAARLLALAPPAENKRTCAGTIYIDDNPALSVADIHAKCCQLDNLGLVVIDYVQLMTWSRGGENRWQLAAEISRMLKIMAKELTVPVLCLSQLSRVVEEREDKRPVLSDLRGSGPFVPEADIVLFLYQGCYYHEKMKKSDMMECIVAKNVYGESGTVELRWRPKGNRFLVSDNMCCW